MGSSTHVARLLLPQDGEERGRTLHDLVHLISDDDAALLQDLLARRQARFDILGNLPTELVLQVLDHLDLQDIHNYAQVCRRWRHLSKAPDTVDFLHSKWLPFHYRTSAEKYEELSQAAAKTYVRTTGIFSVRMTTDFGRSNARLQKLHRNRMYKDIHCTIPWSDTHLDTWQDFDLDLRRPYRTLYAHGVMVWYYSGLDTQLINVHHLRENITDRIHIPSRFLVAGENLELMALGNKYVVAASTRTVCTWNLASKTLFEARLPSRPMSCVTHNDFILLVLPHGRLLAWEPSSRLVDVDTSVLQDPRILSCQDFQHPPIIIHPTEQGTFFAVTRSSSRLWPSVHEITPKGRGYAVSNIFEYKPSKVTDPTYLYGHNNLCLEVRRVDSQGTFKLMNLDPKDPGEPRHYEFLMFNILTKSFSTQSYWNPLEEHSSRHGTQSGATCLWGGQLVSSSDYGAGSTKLLVALEQRQSPPCEQNTDDIHENFRRYVRRLIPEQPHEQDGKRMDVIRHDDIVDYYPTAPDYRSIFGLQYLIRVSPRSCTYDGEHEASCMRLHPSTTPYGPGQPDHMARQAENYQRVDRIFMDDDMMVVVARRSYTAFFVSVNGKTTAMAESE